MKIQRLICIAIGIVVFIAAGTAAFADSSNETDPGGVSGFNPNYLLFGADSLESSDGGGMDELDIKFQLSFSARLRAPRALRDTRAGRFFDSDAPVYFGYTQESYWDIGRESAPFRETNYRPGIFYKNDTTLIGKTSQTYVGYVHESTGLDGDRSGGWDRLYARIRLPFGKSLQSVGFKTYNPSRVMLDGTIWIPFSISENNRDITRYAGYGEMSISYLPVEEYLVRLTIRKGGGFNDWDRGLGELDAIFPLPYTDVQGFAQYTNGYGASVERFDQHEYSLRIGVLFSDFGL